jgi:hypothetical protein
MIRAAAMVVCILSCAIARAVEIELPADSNQTPDTPIVELPKGTRVRESASSWDALLQKATPTFAWNHRDLMWIRYNAKGELEFQLDQATRIEPKGKAATVALVDIRSTDAWLEWPQEFVAATARLRRARPEYDGGSDTYAILISRNRDGSELYDVAWQSLTMGTGLYRTLRHIFVLHDFDGRWRFVGESPGEQDSHYGWSSLQFLVKWTGDANAPVSIHYSYMEGESEASASPDARQTELCTQQEGVLEGTLPAVACWIDEPHGVVDATDSFQSLLLSAAEWRSLYRPGDDDAAQTLRIVERLFLAKNPFLISRIATLGSRIYFPTYAEVSSATESLREARRVKK